MNTYETRFVSEYHEMYATLGYFPKQIKINLDDIRIEIRRIEKRYFGVAS